MKRFLQIALLLSGLSLQVSAVELVFTLNDPLFGLSRSTNRNVLVQFTTGPDSAENAITLNSRRLWTTDTNSSFTISNAVAGRYDCEVQAPPERTRFSLLVRTNNNSTLYATNLLIAASTATFPAGAVAWSAAVTDARYAYRGELASNSGYYVAAGTNVVLETNLSVVTISATATGSGDSSLVQTNYTDQFLSTNGFVLTRAGNTNAQQTFYWDSTRGVFTNSANAYAIYNLAGVLLSMTNSTGNEVYYSSAVNFPYVWSDYTTNWPPPSGRYTFTNGNAGRFELVDASTNYATKFNKGIDTERLTVGTNNFITQASLRSAIIGGRNHRIDGEASLQAEYTDSVIAGGNGHTIRGRENFIGGGNSSIIDSKGGIKFDSAIVGGEGCFMQADCSLIGGSLHATNTAARNAVMLGTWNSWLDDTAGNGTFGSGMIATYESIASGFASLFQGYHNTNIANDFTFSAGKNNVISNAYGATILGGGHTLKGGQDVTLIGMNLSETASTNVLKLGVTGSTIRLTNNAAAFTGVLHGDGSGLTNVPGAGGTSGFTNLLVEFPNARTTNSGGGESFVQVRKQSASYPSGDLFNLEMANTNSTMKGGFYVDGDSVYSYVTSPGTTEFTQYSNRFEFAGGAIYGNGAGLTNVDAVPTQWGTNFVFIRSQGGGGGLNGIYVKTSTNYLNSGVGWITNNGNYFETWASAGPLLMFTNAALISSTWGDYNGIGLGMTSSTPWSASAVVQTNLAILGSLAATNIGGSGKGISNLWGGTVANDLTISGAFQANGSVFGSLGFNASGGSFIGNGGSLTNIPASGLALGATNTVLTSSGTNNGFKGNLAVTNLTTYGPVIVNSNSVSQPNLALTVNGNQTNFGEFQAESVRASGNIQSSGTVTATGAISSSGGNVGASTFMNAPVFRGTSSAAFDLGTAASGSTITAQTTNFVVTGRVTIGNTITVTNGVILPNIASVGTASFTNSVPQSSTTVTNFLLVNLNGNFVTVHTNAAAANSLIYRKISFTESASWP